MRFAAGGSTEIVARLWGDALQQLGQAVVIENKAGAGGMLGTEALAHAAPDGYTVGLGSTSTLAVNPVVLQASRVQPLRDSGHGAAAGLHRCGVFRVSESGHSQLCAVSQGGACQR